MVLETQGAISHKRAKMNVPIAATKRALATLGCVEGDTVDLSSLAGFVAATGGSGSTTTALADSRFSMRVSTRAGRAGGGTGVVEGACASRSRAWVMCALPAWVCPERAVVDRMLPVNCRRAPISSALKA